MLIVLQAVATQPRKSPTNLNLAWCTKGDEVYLLAQKVSARWRRSAFAALVITVVWNRTALLVHVWNIVTRAQIVVRQTDPVLHNAGDQCQNPIRSVRILSQKSSRDLLSQGGGVDPTTASSAVHHENRAQILVLHVDEGVEIRMISKKFFDVLNVAVHSLSVGDQELGTIRVSNRRLEFHLHLGNHAEEWDILLGFTVNEAPELDRDVEVADADWDLDGALMYGRNALEPGDPGVLAREVRVLQVATQPVLLVEHLRTLTDDPTIEHPHRTTSEV